MPTKSLQFLWLCILPIVILVIAACALTIVGHSTIAWFVAVPGMLTWQLIVLGYVVFFDSKRRWPKDSAWGRLGRVLTFTR